MKIKWNQEEETIDTVSILRDNVIAPVPGRSFIHSVSVAYESHQQWKIPGLLRLNLSPAYLHLSLWEYSRKK